MVKERNLVNNHGIARLETGDGRIGLQLWKVDIFGSGGEGGVANPLKIISYCKLFHKA
jgi:hypothetical protein